ncbi:NifU family protein [Pseudothauera rhizosphaerae]|uniref:NifU family protein n=1 Tax=Pseudothauera rhizosphaerae TaxID=2565932 RepID=A0A4S4A8Q9_9RHOO|nr:NifU family protein [Pseudothauera rhizosphaerae]THF55155.1 NifU family protein [Pseudothauera rhizosphaerae]
MDDEVRQSLGPMPDEATIRAASLQVIEELRPGVRRDGGDLLFVGIDGDKVQVRLTGACTTCALAGQTLGGVRRRLVQVLGWPVRVVPASA